MTVSAGRVAVAAAAWWVVGFWLTGLGVLGGAPPASVRPIIAFLPADVAGTADVVLGGLIGGAVLGLLAGSVRRAAAALALGVGLGVLLTWWGPWAVPAVTDTGTDPRIVALLALLLATASAAAAGIGLLARRDPAGSCLLLLLTAVAADPFLHRLHLISPGWPTAARAALVAAAVTVAVAGLTPVSAALTVIPGLVAGLGARAMLVAARAAPEVMHREYGPDRPGDWRPVLAHGVSVGRSWLGGHQARYPIAGLAVVVGVLVGLAVRRLLRRPGVEPEPGVEPGEPGVEPARPPGAST